MLCLNNKTVCFKIIFLDFLAFFRLNTFCTRISSFLLTFTFFLNDNFILYNPLLVLARTHSKYSTLLLVYSRIVRLRYCAFCVHTQSVSQSVCVCSNNVSMRLLLTLGPAG